MCKWSVIHIQHDAASSPEKGQYGTLDNTSLWTNQNQNEKLPTTLIRLHHQYQHSTSLYLVKHITSLPVSW